VFGKSAANSLFLAFHPKEVQIPQLIQEMLISIEHKYPGNLSTTCPRTGLVATNPTQRKQRAKALNNLQKRWVNSEIDNFTYLMHVNEIAGRTLQDLMQYPVFPWILKDYESNELDLNNPNSFRDLTRSMGAQDSSRLQYFKDRYEQLKIGAQSHIEGSQQPFLYGTHYSSAMIVSAYLLRLEPYSTHFVDLQGGNFDLADRLFTSVKDGWDSASQRNTADVKELIPEFFYLPNFLRNENRFRFGEKQSGKMVDDVELPAWANGDPNEFIRIHRYALESPYVSAHLHHWIDLIFGVLQNGKGALDSDNLFHPLFYQSKHYDIFDIEDEMERTGIIGYISNFGQIPRQIFKRAHTEKRGPWNSITRWFGVTAPEEFSKFF
jgi:hypothetical protein